MVVVPASPLELQFGRKFARRYEFGEHLTGTPYFVIQVSDSKNNGRLSKMPVQRQSRTSRVVEPISPSFEGRGNQRGTGDALVKLDLRKCMDRELAALVTAEIDGAKAAIVEESHKRDRHPASGAVTDESNFDRTDGTADPSGVSGIGHKTDEDLPATGEQNRQQQKRNE